MRTTTREEIIEEIKKSLDQHAGSPQRHRQLVSALGKGSSPLVGDALLEHWQTLAHSEDQYAEQEFVAALLFVLNPATSLTLKQVLASLGNWNLSVQEFPWYLALQFGEDQLLHELHVLEEESPCDRILACATETVRYWLRADYVAEHQRYTYHQRGHKI